MGLAAGTGLAEAAAIVLMATPAASEIGGWVDVFASALGISAFAWRSAPARARSAAS
jgi:hypothetical protein